MWSAARHYAIDPMSGDAATLTPEQSKMILGGEACMWSEFVTPENIDSRVWPRVAVVAERLWSPQNVADVSSMYLRLSQLSGRLDTLGLTHNTNYHAALARMSGSRDTAALEVLGSVVEPVKDYTRMDSSTVVVNASTPMNRLIDSVNPESDAAREFGQIVDSFIASGFKDSQSANAIRRSLEQWRDNDARLQPSLQRSLSPLS
jgi:hexosaminidase